MGLEHIWKRLENTGLVRYIAVRLGRLHKWNCPSLDEEGHDTAWLGTFGEDVAVSFLQSQGCKILRRNWRPPHIRGGEIDVICRCADTLVFVEVKTRRGEGFGGPRRAVDAEKRNLIRRGAGVWLEALELSSGKSVPYRYDIIEVICHEGISPECRWIRGAFFESDLS